MAQARAGNLNRRRLRAQPIAGWVDRRRFRCAVGPLGGAFDTANDRAGVRSLGATQSLDRLQHALQRMACQQLQNADIVAHASAVPLPLFQPLPQGLERARKLPIPKDIRVVQRRRPPLQRRQIMQRIENMIVTVITTTVRCHHRSLMRQFDAIDVPLDRHRLKRTMPRDRITHVVEANELVFIDRRFRANAGIKPTRR